MSGAPAVLRVGDRTIGAGRTFIAAEIGSNHGQDIRRARELVDAAKDAGADAVKFQSVRIDALYARPSRAVRALHRKIDLDERWHGELKAHCDRRGIVFFSSPTYLGAVDILERVGVKLYKLASAQVGVFPQMVERVAACRKPVLLSTGLVTPAELRAVVRVFRKCGNEQFVIMHCNSIYPAPYDRVNLGMLGVYRQMTGALVGYSDHTRGIAVSLAAVALGAVAIEKHLTLDRGMKGPDSAVSLEPHEFRRLVEGIRAVELAARKRSRERIEPEEKAFKDTIAYRLVLKGRKRAGEGFCRDDFEFTRCESGIDCRDMLSVIRRARTRRDLDAGTILTRAMVEDR